MSSTNQTKKFHRILYPKLFPLKLLVKAKKIEIFNKFVMKKILHDYKLYNFCGFFS